MTHTINLSLHQRANEHGDDLLLIEVGVLKISAVLSEKKRLALIELLAGGRRNVSVDVSMFCPMLPTPDKYTAIDGDFLRVKKGGNE